MGEAKRRGTRDERVAQALGRRATERAARLQAAQLRHEMRMREIAEAKPAPPVVLTDTSPRRLTSIGLRGIMLAAMLAAVGPVLIVDPTRGERS
jgi:hypothetical protein